MLIAILLGVSGCSIARLAIDNLDWLALRRLDGFLDLDGVQRERLGEALSAVLDQQRRDRFTHYADLLRRAEGQLMAGLTLEGLESLFAEARAAYEDVAARVLPPVAIAVSSLSPAQAEHLAEEMREANEEFAARFGLEAPEKRPSLRAERTEERMRFWVGKISDDQRQLIASTGGLVPDHVDRWHTFRLGMQTELLRLVAARAGAGALAAHLREWWVTQEGLGPASYVQSRSTHVQVAKVLIALDRTLTTAQREHARARLRSLAEDLEAAAARKPITASQSTPYHADG